MKEVLACFLLSLVAMYVEIYHEEAIERSSANLIALIQSISFLPLNIFFILVGYITAICFLVLSALIYLLIDREAGLMGMIGGFLGGSISGSLKMMLGHPRPFWAFEFVEGMQCPRDFGSPSGHALSAGAALFVLGSYWMKGSKDKTSKVLVILFFALFIGFDRLYLGVHFYFQVVLGYSLASLIAAVMLEKNVFRSLQRIGSDKRVLYIFNGIMLLLFVVHSVAYFNMEHQYQDFWGQIYSGKCQKSLDIVGTVFKNSTDATLSLFVSGLVSGFYHLDSKSLPTLSARQIWGALGLIAVDLLYLVGVDFIIGRFLKNYIGLVLIAVHRFITGFALCFVAPVLLRWLSNRKDSYSADTAFLNKMK